MIPCVHTFPWRDLPLPTALESIRESGITTLELDASPGSAHLDPLAGREAAGEVRSLLAGFQVAAVSAEHPDLPRREEEGGDEAVAYTVAAIKRAADLRVPVVCVSLGNTDVDAWDTAWQRALTALRMALYQTSRTRVKVAVTLTPDDVLNSLRKARRLLDGIDNPRLGLALDTGVMHYLRIQMSEALLVAGERLFHVRLRDATRTDPNRPLGAGQMHLAPLLRQLREHGYEGALSLSPPGPADLVPSATLLRQALSGQ